MDIVELDRTEENGKFEIKLKNPIEYNGEKFKKLEFDFYELTGRDALNIEDELQALGKTVFVPAFSGEYLVRMAAKACIQNISSESISELCIADYNKVISRAKSFLLSSD